MILPTKRSSAEAFHLMASHALGEAGAPYLIGVISDRLKEGIVGSDTGLSEEHVAFLALQRSFLLAFAILLTGALLFLVAAYWIKEDREKAVVGAEGTGGREEDKEVRMQ